MKKLLLLLFTALLAVGPLASVTRAQGPVLDPSFAVTSAVGKSSAVYPQISDMALQPDGKLIIIGDFATINNTPAAYICRLLPDGQVDASFATNVNGSIYGLALQADGKLLIVGRFDTVAGQPRVGVARLMADGTLDGGFTPPFINTSLSSSDAERVVIQPGVGILVTGGLLYPSTPLRAYYLARLNATTGALDSTFRPAFNPFGVTDVLVQPNGNLVFAGAPHLIRGQQCNVWQTLPNGALDPAFAPLPGTQYTFRVVRDPATANIYAIRTVTGSFGNEPIRLLPTGAPDPAFNTAGAFRSGAPPEFRGLTVQPNGRVLLCGTFTTSATSAVGSWRLLPSGARDPSYQAENGPSGNYGAQQALVQPNGALVFCGDFNEAGGFALNCLARMLDPNVLATSKQQTEAGTAAWPVPAHDVLYLHLPPGDGPRPVTLLDVLGREVLRRTVAAGQQALTLPLAGLPTGCYLLHVAYPSGPVVRRVAVE